MIKRLAPLAAVLLVPATAQAHVTVQPDTATPGGFAVENVRVPNETDDAVTTKVDVQLPPGFAEASYESTPGWTVKVEHRKLDKPIQTDDGPVTQEVARITWTAASKADGIQPGQFRDFPLSVQIPDRTGSLTFKALQTYSDGKVVRWIGPPNADEPAPVVKVAKAAAVAATAKASSGDDSDSSKTLAIIALALAAVSLALTLARFRRP